MTARRVTIPARTCKRQPLCSRMFVCRRVCACVYYADLQLCVCVPGHTIGFQPEGVVHKVAGSMHVIGACGLWLNALFWCGLCLSHDGECTHTRAHVPASTHACPHWWDHSGEAKNLGCRWRARVAGHAQPQARLPDHALAAPADGKEAPAAQALRGRAGLRHPG